MLNGSYADSNFMGTGKRVAVDLNTGRYQKVYSFCAHRTRTPTSTSLSRTLSLRYTDVTQFVSASSDFSSKTLALGLEYGYPITESQVLRFGATLQQAELLTTSSGSALQAQNWVQQNGNPYSRSAVDDFGNIYEFFGSKFTALELTHRLVVDDAEPRPVPRPRHAPPAHVHVDACPAARSSTSSATTTTCSTSRCGAGSPAPCTCTVAYGDGFGDTTSLPPFRQFYAGGPDTSAATARAGWARRTTSATPTAATC